MTDESLQDIVDSKDNLVEYFRDLDLEETIWEYPGEPYSFDDEYTNWIEEQRAWRESVAFMDQSYHMANHSIEQSEAVEGPDAIDLFSDIAVNGFDDFRSGDPPMAKQLVLCNPDGYMIGDCILFYLEEGRFLLVGESVPQKWVQYHAETGDYDVNGEFLYDPIHEGGPVDFRFEIMGPDARDVLEEVTDGSMPDISFFQMDTLTINGHEVYALGHQMTGEFGLEIFGSYEHHDEIKDLIFEAGEEYGIRQLGVKSYTTTPVELGWIPLPLPAIYSHEGLRDYREWVDAHSLEAHFPLGGSFRPDDISEYYVTPTAMGYDHIVNFDHDFIGKDALREMIENPEQKRVTFVLNPDDVVDVYASLFREGDTYKFMNMPSIPYHSDLSRYDTILKDGAVVGAAKHIAYNYNEREMLGLGYIDTEYSEPGTGTTLRWSDKGADKSQVERHVETDIQATVAPAPYVERGRRSE